MVKSPISRSDWASFDWKEAQNQVGLLFKKNGFKIFQEKKLENNKRADIIVIKENPTMVIIGVIEVKCYQKISRSLEKSAMRQALNYLEDQYTLSENNYNWRRKNKKYFACVVYTRDYPTSFLRHTINNYDQFDKIKNIEKNSLYLFYSTPNTVMDKLKNYIYIENKQQRIDDFFENEGQD